MVASTWETRQVHCRRRRLTWVAGGWGALASPMEGKNMAAQIGADFEQMLENIHTLVKSIEGAGVGTRSIEMDGLRTNTTASYLDAASAYAGEIERMIGGLASNTAAFRDAIAAVMDEKEQSEQNLSAALSRVTAIVDDPTLTSSAQLTQAASAASSDPAAVPDATTKEDDSESGGY